MLVYVLSFGKADERPFLENLISQIILKTPSITAIATCKCSS